MEGFLRDHPFDQSVFVMVRYRDRNDRLIAAITKQAAKFGFNAILARDHDLTDDLYNPVACLLCCSKGLAIFDQPEQGQVVNPNVAYELGMMHLLGRDCRVLKHAKLAELNVDIDMKLRKEYATVEEAAAVVREWLGAET